jgi:putative phage-type endonuclease
MTREEWLETRRGGIGGSDISAIAGMNPWRSPLAVYLDKRGEIEDGPDNERMYWGRQLEDVVARHFAEVNNVKIRRVKRILRHRKYDFFIANLDRTITRPKHVPAPGERGEMVGVYSVAHYKDGGYNFTYLTKHDIDRTRARSASAKSGRSPWDTDEEAMWKKTAIRALRSVLPLQVEQTLQVEAEPGDMKPVDFDEAPTNFDTETGEVFDAEIVEEEEPLPPEEMDDGQQ